MIFCYTYVAIYITMPSDLHRRPIWRPSRLAGLKASLTNLLAHISPKRFAIAFIGLPLALYVCRDVVNDALIIDPISVPKRFEEAGLTSEVMSNRVANAIRKIESETDTWMKTEAKATMKMDDFRIPSLRDESSTPDVEIPGTKIGLKTLVDITRAIFGVYPKHVCGDIVALSARSSSPADPQLKVTIYLTRGKERSRSISFYTNATDIDELATKTAETILRQVNPYVLASYSYEQGRINDAADIVNGILSDPTADSRTRPAAFNFLGNILQDQKEYGEAVTQYRKAIQLDPQNPGPHANLGLALQNLKRYDEATLEYTKAVELDSKNPLPYLNWANALYEEKRYGEAVAKYRQASELDPGDAGSHLNWGNVLQDLQKYNEAIAQYQKASELNPQNPLPYIEWGNALGSQKKYEEAIARYQKASELDPKNPLPYFNWAKALYDQQKYGEAITKYQKASRLDPNDADSYLNWGMALQNQHKYDEAIAKYQKASELDPKNPLPYLNWANVLYDQRKYDGAITSFEKASQLDPKNPIPVREGGILRFYLGRSTQSQEDLVHALQLDPSDAYSAIWLYLARARAGQDAKRELQKNAARLNLGDWPGQVVQLYLEKLSSNAVLDSAKGALTKESKSKLCEVHFFVGEYMLLRGNRADAIRRFKDATATRETDNFAYRGAQLDLRRLTTP
jgi:tetratricopeptide (TPR) repeat protein